MRSRRPWIVATAVLLTSLLLAGLGANAAGRRGLRERNESLHAAATVCAANLDLKLAQQAGWALTLAVISSWSAASDFDQLAERLRPTLGNGAVLLLNGEGELRRSVPATRALRVALPSRVVAFDDGSLADSEETPPGDLATPHPGLLFGLGELDGRTMALSLAPSGSEDWIAVAVDLGEILATRGCSRVDGIRLEVLLPYLETGQRQPSSRPGADFGMLTTGVPVGAHGRLGSVVATAPSGRRDLVGLWTLAAILSLTLAITAFWSVGRDERHATETEARERRLEQVNRRWVEEASRRAAVEEAAARTALIDPLTRLSTRADLQEKIDRALARVRERPDYQIAILFLGINRFKNVNESMGQLAGDRVLSTVGQRLKEAVRPGDGTARIGGDRFAALLYDLNSEAVAVQVAERLHTSLREPLRIDGHDIFITIRVGVALADDGLESASEFLTRAETAMFEAKAGGGEQTAVFHPAMELRAGSALQLESDLRRAFASDQFELFYHPIIDLQQGALAGMEALLRWRHPVDGLVPPDRFIPLAEETGLIVPLTRRVLAKAFDTLSSWQHREVASKDFYVSVNISSRDFDEPGLCEYVHELVQSHRLPTGSIRIELTEGALLRNFEVAASRLGELHAMGIPLLLDDFGTGYSSLSYLNHFPFDFVKIDRSFVTNMSEPGGDRGIVRTIVELARNMNIGVVAEGVETEREAAALLQLGCRYAQGYLYARPLPEGEASAFITSHRLVSELS